MTRRIDISAKTIVFVTLFLLSLWIIYQILDVILIFFVAFIFMSALAPLVEKFVSWKVPKVIAVLSVFILAIFFIVGIITIGLAPFVSQTNNLLNALSVTIPNMLQTAGIDQSLIQQQLSSLSGQVVNFTVDAFVAVISLISIVVITVYMLLDREKIEDYGTSFFGTKQDKARLVLRMIEDKLGAWLRGQIVLSAIIGVFVYIGLELLRINYALPLALLAGLLEVVPVIGPIIAAIPAVLIALATSPLLAGLTALLYFVIQQLEGHIVVPQVMKKAVGLNPLLVILAISVGNRLLGIVGALLAVPIAVVIQLLIQEGLKIEKELDLEI